MSGELLLEKKTGALPALLLSLLATAGVSLVLLKRISLPAEGAAMRAGMAALMAYVLFRVLYPAMRSLLPKGDGAAGTWRVTEDTLYLNERAIPRSEIRQIYCWPNRDALGHTGGGWVVNIETDRGHTVLRSLSRGEDAERSERQLRAMVVALGFGASWQAGP